MAVNTESHFWLTKAFLPAMLKKNHGHIVTVASAAGMFQYSLSLCLSVSLYLPLRPEIFTLRPAIYPLRPEICPLRP